MCLLPARRLVPAPKLEGENVGDCGPREGVASDLREDLRRKPAVTNTKPPYILINWLFGCQRLRECSSVNSFKVRRVSLSCIFAQRRDGSPS